MYDSTGYLARAVSFTSKLERPARDKHSNLLNPFVSYNKAG